MGCEAPHVSRGMCRNHYNQFRNSPEFQYLQPPSIEDRFWSKVDKSGECWDWIAGRNHFGYGTFSYRNGTQRTVKAHRFAWEVTHGPIPQGKLIDHICHNKGCVNPEHLRLASYKQNAENRQAAQVNNKSGVRGVYWEKQTQKWRGLVYHNKRKHFAGEYDTLEAAAVGVAAKRNELFTHNAADRS